MSITLLPIRELAEQVRGVSYAKQDATTTPREGLVAVLRAGNITDAGLVLDDLVYVPRRCVADNQMLRRHDILVATSSGSLDVVGKAAQATGDLAAAFGAFCKVLRPRASIEPRYFAYYFRTAEYRRRISTLAAGANINNLRNEHLDDLLVPVPPLPEQHRIADILDKAYAIRRGRKEAIALTEELLRTAFLEMFGDPVTNPKGWPVKPFRQLLAMPLRNGLSPASNGRHAARVLTLSAITRRVYDPTAWKDGMFAVEPWDDVRVDGRDFLICRGNGNKELVGRGAFPVASDSSLVFPDTMIAARTDDAQVAPAFLVSVWKSPSVRSQIEAGARTTNGTFKINQGAVEAIEIVCPPRELQEPFQRLANRSAQTLARYQEGQASAERLFDSLVARAFSGRLGTC